MYDEEYNMVMNDIHNRIFIVNAPNILRHTEFERKEFDVCNDWIDGEKIDTSMEIMTYGMTLYNIAKHAMDGFGITLYNPNDFEEIYRLLKKYKEYTTGATEYEVNMSQRSIEERDLLYAFAEEVFALNKDRLPNITFQFKRMTDSMNIVMPETRGNKKIKITKRAKRITEW